ncbi:hypothetical protein L7F22_042474 [Adiantum nelumboides]|nr:hypothetical protein [Adiantum nelumboides]
MIWYFDSGASRHITSRKDLFCSLDAAPAGKKVTCANNASYPIKGVGKILITISDSSDLCLPDVLYVLGIKKNLLSVSSLAKNGLRVIFEDDRCIVRDRENGYPLITTGTLENGLFVLDRYEKQIHTCIAETKTQAMQDAELWHARFGHVGYGSLMTLQCHNMVHDLSLLEMPPRHVCEGCVLGKMHRFAFSQDGSVRTTRKLQLVHSDVCGPMRTPSMGNSLYFVTFIDDFSRFCWVYPLKEKSDVFAVFQHYVSMVENETGCKVQTLRTDRGGEYMSGAFKDFLGKKGIKHQCTMPYTPQQNGVAERKNRSLMEMARCMLKAKSLPHKLWMEAVVCAAHVLNRCPTRALKTITPYESWYDRKPSVSYLRVFGCLAYAHIPQQLRGKLDDKAVKCIFVGYSSGSKGCRLYNPATNKIFESHDVIFAKTIAQPMVAFDVPHMQTQDVFEELQEYEYTFIVENSTRASLADVLTYKVKEKKITPKAQVKLDLSPQGELEDAYTLLFDGAYRRQSNKAAGGFVILNEEKKEVLKKGIQLHLAHSNNEAEYATLKAGLEECKSMGIRRLMVEGDALLIVRQVQGTWACKNSKLLQWLHEVKLLMKDFEAIQIQHISRQHNKEADNMANTQFEVMVGAIKFKEPLFQGQETMEDILYFLETGEVPKYLERVQRHRLVRKALSYQLIGEHLYHKGKDLVLRRVPLIKEIEKILMSCHDGVCGGHFAQEITSRKILQAGFVWPSLHRDVQHWCKACKACQQAGDRKLSYGPRFPIFAYGPFEKWGIDAIGPLPRTSTGKQYILTATDYMTRWAEAASVARITTADVSKFVLDYICSRFGTPLEILSDRGPGFRADLLDALLEYLSIKHVHSTPYYPQTSFKVSTQFTPYHLVYGQEALLPIEVELGSLRVLARETTSSKEKLEQRILDLQRLELDREAATDYYITQANKKREQFNNEIKEKKLEEGMLVMRYDSRLDLSHSKKFLQRWEGPYVIFKKFKNGSYWLQDLSGKIHKYPINGWRLKEFFQRIQPIQEERQVSLDA